MFCLIFIYDNRFAGEACNLLFLVRNALVGVTRFVQNQGKEGKE